MYFPVKVMPPKGNKIKRFLTAWLDKAIDGCRTKVWLAPHPEDSTKAICKLCPGVTANKNGKAFSITEGWTAVTSHASGAKHKQYLEEVQTDPNHNR